MTFIKKKKYVWESNSDREIEVYQVHDFIPPPPKKKYPKSFFLAVLDSTVRRYFSLTICFPTFPMIFFFF